MCNFHSYKKLEREREGDFPGSVSFSSGLGWHDPQSAITCELARKSPQFDTHTLQVLQLTPDTKLHQFQTRACLQRVRTHSWCHWLISPRGQVVWVYNWDPVFNVVRAQPDKSFDKTFNWKLPLLPIRRAPQAPEHTRGRAYNRLK